MKRAVWTLRVLGIFALAFLSQGAAANVEPSNSIRHEDTPRWVTPTPVDVTVAVDNAESSDGFCTLIDDQRIRVGRNDVERYFRRIRRIVSVAGIESQAEVSIEVEPEYQKLVMHTVRIHRAGVAIDAMPTVSSRLVQAESDSNRHVYRGTITAHLILQDVRVGDTIEIAYSVRGQNPVLDHHFVGNFSLGGYQPTRRLRREVVVEHDHLPKLHFRVHGKGPEPIVTERADAQIMTWDLENIEEVPLEDRLPGPYYDIPWVQLSDYERWEDVVNWGLALYSFKRQVAPDFQKQLAEIRASSTNLREQALRAVRFVQDEVRYLSISVGPYSHRPHDPAQVLTQRFGDCKDKSLLLVAILRELGIDAHVALVNTTINGGIVQLLPSAYDFDHVVVKAMVDDKPIWIDATASNQGGTLDTEIPASFGTALVLGPGVHELENMPSMTLNEPDETISSELHIDTNGVAKFDVKTVFRGRNADEQRNLSSRTSRSQLAHYYLEFHAQSHPEIHESEPLDVQDDRAANVLTTVGRYEIPDFWEKDSGSFDSDILGPFLLTPRVRKRYGPLAVDHPNWQSEDLRVHYPQQMHVESQSVNVENAAFYFSYSLQSIGNEIVLHREYRSKSDVVPSSEIDAHIARLEEAREYLYFKVPMALEVPVHEPFRMTRTLWIVTAIVGGVIVLGIGLAVWLPGRRRRAFFRRRKGILGEQPAHSIFGVER